MSIDLVECQFVSPQASPELYKSSRRAPEKQLRRHVEAAAKRTFDIALATAGLVFLLPLIALMSGVILVLQGRPIFIRHNRIGRGGRTFPCIKFRSMFVNADELLKLHLQRDPAAREEWEATQKLKNDPRITPIGKFLRKSSVDELPQLLNIIRGEMSIVGPRPIVQNEVARYGHYINEYKSVRPGLTGLWQVSGRNDVSYDDRVKLDAKYVREQSFWGDIVIVANTVPAVLKSAGSY